MDYHDKKVLFIGAGAIGASVAAWVAPHHADLYIMDTGEVQQALKQEGITVYQSDNPETTRETVRIKTVQTLSELPDVDIIVLAIKNYSLPAMAEMIEKTLGDRPVIVSMANGTDNQSILSRYFSKVIYTVVSFNARRDEPVVVAYQKKGPLLIGTPDNSLREELRMVQAILGRGCETIIVDHLADAVHSKIVMNLTNALDTLVGQGYQPISNFAVYQKLLPNTLWEGVKIIKAAGFKECRMGGMPSFSLLHLGAIMPAWIARPVFKRKIKTMLMSSMTQDVLLRDSGASEIESLTGYIVRLAEKHKVPAPYNATIFRLAKEKFGPGFKPMRCEDVMAAVEQAKHAAA
ncbi:MAG: 2-dehydropantoate 2-reductase [Syntrophaceae bacterium]